MWKQFKYHLYGAIAKIISASILLVAFILMIVSGMDFSNSPMLNTSGTIVSKYHTEAWRRPYPPQWLPAQYYLTVNATGFSGTIHVSEKTYSSSNDGQKIELTYKVGKWSKSISVVDFKLK